MYNWKNELWDGKTIQYRVVTVVMADNLKAKFYWGRPYVGQRRQALEIISDDYTFYIDNEGGLGLNKVIGGAHMGKGHRSLTIDDAFEIIEVDECDIIYPTPELITESNTAIEKACEEMFGEEYTEIRDRLRASLKNIQAGKINGK